jgi:hypothetical protein
MSSSSLAGPDTTSNAINSALSTNSKIKTHLDVPRTTSSIINDGSGGGGSSSSIPSGGGESAEEHDDRFNYALLLALYTLQGIPMVR